MPQLADVARDCPEIASTIHAIYYEEDPVPRLMKVLDLPCSTLGRDNTEAGLHIKVKELPKSVSIKSCLLWCMGYEFIYNYVFMHTAFPGSFDIVSLH